MKLTRFRPRVAWYYLLAISLFIFVMSFESTSSFFFDDFDGIPLPWQHHLYDRKLLKKKLSDPKCSKYYNSTSAPTFYLKNNLWRIFPSTTSHNPRDINKNKVPVLFGTEEAQDILTSLQNPQSCDGAKYAVLDMSFSGAGLGSSLHQLTYTLVVALEEGRIAVFPDSPWMSGKFCDTHSFDCVFFPPSKCQPKREDVLKANYWRIGEPKDAKVIRMNIKSKDDVSLQSYPRVFSEILQCSPIPENHYYYWWRAQAITYLVRPNTRTLAKLKELQETIFNGQEISPGTTNIHIRHGDKWKEMRLFELSDYLHPFPHLINHYNLSNTIFLSTEDPKVINDTTRETSYKFLYTEETRKNENFEGLVENGVDRTLKDLLNLYLAVQSDASITTLGSNWNRLIDELKSTIGLCAGCPFIDISQCSSVDECKKKGVNFQTYQKR